jgi:hypothetical protein
MKLKTVANVVREIKSETRQVVSKMLRYYAAGMMLTTVKKQEQQTALVQCMLPRFSKTTRIQCLVKRGGTFKNTFLLIITLRK